MDVQINERQRLYVIPAEGGYSCKGFDVALREAQALADTLGHPELRPADAERGTLEVLEKHRELIRLAQGQDIGTWFHPETPRKARRILEAARKDGSRLRIFYGDTKTGRDWMEENDVLGTIGRSTGVLKIPLMLAEGEHGGPGLLEHCIVRIIRVDDRRELYRHSQYHLGLMEIEHELDPPYVATVRVDGKVHARFRTNQAAYHWMAYMAGESFHCPE